MAITKKTGKKISADQLVNYQIVTMPIVRRSADVGNWRNALRNADIGRMASLYQLYEDMLIDGVLSDAVSKRIDAIKNSDMIFTDANGKSVDDINDIIDTEAFELLLDEIMQRRFWGRAGVEFDFTQGFNVRVIPRRHISLETQSILLYENDIKGIPYTDDPFILVLGDRKDKGLFNQTSPLVIYKRGGFGDWSQFVELFGMPQRIGKYNSYDLSSRDQLLTALKDAGSAPYLVVPDTTEVEQVNNSGQQSSATYNDFRKACNEEILISLLGQTLTTTQGDKGARSLGEVHQDVEDSKHKSDMRYVTRILNEKVIPILEQRGFPVRGGKFIFPKSGPELTVTDIVQLSAVLPIPQQYLYDKFGIPKPANNEDIAINNLAPISASEPDDKKLDPKEKEQDKKLNDPLSFFV